MSVILLVEDDDDMREDLAFLLENRGYRVVTAENGQAALAVLASNERPCLILLDLMMPVMNGWELRAELMANPELANIPVVVVSGIADLEQEAETLGAINYITKPFELKKLYGLIGTHCNEA